MFGTGSLPSQKAPCNQFRAIELAMLGSKACDITSIVAIACAQHGCFAPNSIADLFRGEQQKNIDWVLLQALQRTNMDLAQGTMLIYDIACQYFVHIQDRIGHLLPVGLTLDRAISLFHIHGHKEECFFAMLHPSYLMLESQLVRFWRCYGQPSVQLHLLSRPQHSPIRLKQLMTTQLTPTTKK